MEADRWGVAHGYNGAAGEWVPASAATRTAIRRSLRAPESDIGDPGPAASSTVVLGPNDSIDVGRGASVVLEDGSAFPVQGDLLRGRDLPIGYHRIADDNGSTRSLLVAPDSCTPVGDRHGWGWAVQLYAMRSTRSWGIGEFRDLATLSSWSAKRGASFVLINPQHAAAPILSQQPSPYFPTSRCFRNPLALSIELLPGYAECRDSIEPVASDARALNADRRIDRDRVFRAKYDALEALWKVWPAQGTELQKQFDAYRSDQGKALADFATFSAIVEQQRDSWMRWPAGLRHPDGGDVAAFRRDNAPRIAFHEWLQWLVDGQLAEAAPGLDLMTDLAIGVDRGGADAWMWQDSFALDMSVGAPPDAFNTQGQNWGLPPFDPWRLRANGYEPFIRTVRSSFRHAQALRIDHVMGLFRLYWIPVGATAAEGCYVYTPFRDLLGIIAIESHRSGAYVVGEDLGTVEDYVRDELTAKKVLSYRLRQFETVPTSEFPEQALAAISTHDLPTIAGFWNRSDIAAQESIGLEPNVKGTEQIRSSLATWSGVDPARGGEAVDEVVLGAYRDLATAPCALVSASLDDVLGVEERPNMPGTIDQWPNWRIALPVPLEDALADPRTAAVCAILDSRA